MSAPVFRPLPDVGTVPPARTSQPVVCPVLVSRVAGLPVAVLDDVAARHTAVALDQVRHHEHMAAQLADAIADDLYAAVPTLEQDKHARRAAISLRRDIHNGRWSERVAAAVQTVHPALPADSARRLDRWVASMRAGESARAHAEQTGPDELRRAGEALIAHLRTPAVASGLSLASPEFTLRLLRERDAADPDSRFARSATAYLTRVALKTSPFSALTTVGLASFTEDSSPQGKRPPRSGGSRVVSTARALAVTLLFACARDPRAAAMIDVVVNRGLRQVDGQWLANLPGYGVAEGFCFRHDELIDCGTYAWLLAALPDTPEALSGLADRLAEPSLVRRLVDTGILQPVPPWAATETRVFTALARSVHQREHVDLPAFTAAVDRLADAETTMSAESIDPAARVAAVGTARTAMREALAALGRPAPFPVAHVTPFHELVAAPADLASRVPTSLRDDLAEAARWLAPLTVRDGRYERLVRFFVRRYGPGGVCTDATDFVYALLAALDTGAVSPVLASRQDPAEDPDRLRGDHTLAHAAHTLFFQLAAPDPGALAAGDYTMAINVVHSGAVGLLARWAAVPALSERIGVGVRDWLAEQHPACRVYQISTYPDWADLQRPVLAQLPRLRGPGDLPEPASDELGSADLDQITLAHNPVNDTVQAYDRDGTPVAFAYLATVPQHQLTGPAGVLALLSNPWITLGAIDRSPRSPDPATSRSDRITVLPRVQCGRLVWARARWSVPVDRLPEVGPTDPPETVLAAMRRWRAEHDLPEEVFVRPVVADLTAPARKPQWLGFAHPHSISVVLRQIRTSGASVVDLVEALPGRTQHWASDSAGSSVATEFIGMVRHA